MTESKQAVEDQQGENPNSATKQQGAASSRSRKPSTPRAQAKSTRAKSPAKTTVSPGRSGGSVSTLKENASRAEALEHENVAVQNKKTAHSHTDPTDVSGVIVPSDKEEMNNIVQERPIVHEEDNKHGHKKEEHKHHSKDKKEHSVHNETEIIPDTATDAVDPHKHLETLKQKALKSEKKVKKLKKKVHKAEKKDIKPSKIRALKEKLTKAFSKWQRRKKKLEEEDK